MPKPFMHITFAEAGQMAQRNMSFFLGKLWRFTYKEFLSDIGYTLSFLGRWISIFMFVALFYYLGEMFGYTKSAHLEAYGGHYFPFVLIGMGAVTFLGSMLNGLSSTVGREQSMGTLEVFLSTPTSLGELIVAFCSYNMLMGVLTAAVCFLFGVFLGAGISQVNMVAVFLIIVLCVLIFVGLGLLSSACLIVFKRGDPIAWITGNFLWFFGGLYFPVSVFPEDIQKFSYCLPSTYAFHALRLASLKGYSVVMLKDEIIILGIFAALLILGGIRAFQYALDFARRRGTIVLQ